MNKINVGNCFKDDENIENILNELENESIDIIICDLPRIDEQKELIKYENIFNKRLLYINREKYKKNVLKKYIENCLILVDECLRVLKQKGTLYIYDIDDRIGNYIMNERYGYCKVRRLIWYYENKIVHNSKSWQHSYISILYCYKDKKPNFNLDDIKEKRKKGEEYRLPKDVFNIPFLAGRYGLIEKIGHPEQKPLELCDKLIRASMLKDEKTTLLVPFAGSGSECLVAKNLGIDFIAYEKDSKWVEKSNKRIDFLKQNNLSLEDLRNYYRTYLPT